MFTLFFFLNVFPPPLRGEQNLKIRFSSRKHLHSFLKYYFKIENDMKITMFQYKIIHNILATNVSLFRAKIRDYDICPQCLADHRRPKLTIGGVILCFFCYFYANVQRNVTWSIYYIT